MKHFIRYLIVFVCMFGFWTWFTWGTTTDPDWMDLHWIAVTTVSFFSLLPVVIYDAASAFLKD